MLNRYMFASLFIVILSSPAVGGEASVAVDCTFAPVNQDMQSFPGCIVSDGQGTVFVADRYKKKLHYRQHDLAEVYSEPYGWMYVDRKGRVIIRGVAAMDNGADSFHDGLVRFSDKGKWGFADVTGKVVIQPKYDGAMNFKQGVAKVCMGCKDSCAESDCEYHQFSGGEWLCLDTKGKRVAACSAP